MYRNFDNLFKLTILKFFNIPRVNSDDPQDKFVAFADWSIDGSQVIVKNIEGNFVCDEMHKEKVIPERNISHQGRSRSLDFQSPGNFEDHSIEKYSQKGNCKSEKRKDGAVGRHFHEVEN